MNDKSYLSVNTFLTEYTPPLHTTTHHHLPPLNGAGAEIPGATTHHLPLDEDKLSPISSGLMDLFFYLLMFPFTVYDICLFYYKKWPLTFPFLPERFKCLPRKMIIDTVVNIFKLFYKDSTRNIKNNNYN